MVVDYDTPVMATTLVCVCVCACVHVFDHSSCVSAARYDC